MMFYLRRVLQKTVLDVRGPQVISFLQPIAHAGGAAKAKLVAFPAGTLLSGGASLRRVGNRPGTLWKFAGGRTPRTLAPTENRFSPQSFAGGKAA
jgi:hypothetical protein